MSETDETPPADDAQEADQGGDEFDADRAKAKIAKANSEAANLRKRLRELEPMAKKAKELEDASKSEQEKLQERMTAAEARAQEAELKALRMEVAASKGLTAVQARRLVGSSKEDLETDADDLLASFGDSRKPPSRRPTENLRGGSDPDDEPEETDPKKLAAMHPRAGF